MLPLPIPFSRWTGCDEYFFICKLTLSMWFTLKFSWNYSGGFWTQQKQNYWLYFGWYLHHTYSRYTCYYDKYKHIRINKWLELVTQSIYKINYIIEEKVNLILSIYIATLHNSRHYRWTARRSGLRCNLTNSYNQKLPRLPAMKVYCLPSQI